MNPATPVTELSREDLSNTFWQPAGARYDPCGVQRPAVDETARPFAHSR
jgi:hypothetical protein